jgi:hypothetical protein
MTSAVTHADAPAAGLPGVIGRRWPTGVGFLATAVSLTVVAPLPERVQTYVSAWCVLLAAVVYLTWGVAHHRADRVVPRWYAERCLVADVLLATTLLTVGSL